MEISRFANSCDVSAMDRKASRVISRFLAWSEVGILSETIAMEVGLSSLEEVQES